MNTYLYQNSLISCFNYTESRTRNALFGAESIVATGTDCPHILTPGHLIETELKFRLTDRQTDKGE